MSIHGIDELLAGSSIFEGMSPEHLELIAGCATNAHFAAGDYVYREGEAASTFYVIRRGSIALEIAAPPRGALIVETLHEGDLLGWSWLFSPYRLRFDARVVEPVRAISFDGACLRGKCEADHDLGFELMRRFSQVVIERLQATRLRLMDIYGTPG